MVYKNLKWCISLLIPALMRQPTQTMVATCSLPRHTANTFLWIELEQAMHVIPRRVMVIPEKHTISWWLRMRLNVLWILINNHKQFKKSRLLVRILRMVWRLVCIRPISFHNYRSDTMLRRRSRVRWPLMTKQIFHPHHNRRIRQGRREWWRIFRNLRKKRKVQLWKMGVRKRVWLFYQHHLHHLKDSVVPFR